MKKLLLILSLLFSLLYSKDIELKISCGFSGAEAELIRLVLSEGFKRADIKLLFEINPNQISLLKASQGVVDGEATRVKEMNKIFPSLFRVPVSTHYIQLVAVSKKEIFLKTPSDLKDYRVGVIQGMKIAEKLAKNLSQRPISAVVNDNALMKLLHQDQIDVMITNKIALLTNHTNLVDNKIYVRDEPIISRPLYMHLHKKHKALIPRFEKAFKSMIEDGTYNSIHRNFTSQLEENLKTSLKLIHY